MYTLPPLFYVIFVIIEPISTLSGFLYIMMSPERFLAEQKPLVPETLPTISQNVNATVLQLANCYLLLFMISTAVLRSTSEKSVVRNFVATLLLGDLGHVYLTYVAVGSDYFFSPSEWNLLTHGNITFTVFLFLSRAVYLLGWGWTIRTPTKAKSK